MDLAGSDASTTSATNTSISVDDSSAASGRGGLCSAAASWLCCGGVAGRGRPGWRSGSRFGRSRRRIEPVIFYPTDDVYLELKKRNRRIRAIHIPGNCFVQRLEGNGQNGGEDDDDEEEYWFLNAAPKRPGIEANRNKGSKGNLAGGDGSLQRATNTRRIFNKLEPQETRKFPPELPTSGLQNSRLKRKVMQCQDGGDASVLDDEDEDRDSNNSLTADETTTSANKKPHPANQRNSQSPSSRSGSPSFGFDIRPPEPDDSGVFNVPDPGESTTDGSGGQVTAGAPPGGGGGALGGDVAPGGGGGGGGGATSDHLDMASGNFLKSGLFGGLANIGFEDDEDGRSPISAPATYSDHDEDEDSDQVDGPFKNAGDSDSVLEVGLSGRRLVFSSPDGSGVGSDNTRAEASSRNAVAGRGLSATSAFDRSSRQSGGRKKSHRMPNQKQQQQQKPLLFFIHGVAGSADTWTSQLKYFSDDSDNSRRYECVATDLLGHGFSSAPDKKSAYVFEKLLTDTLTVFDHFTATSIIKNNLMMTHATSTTPGQTTGSSNGGGNRGGTGVTAFRSCVVIGHGYGCSIAAALAKQRPESVKALVLIAGGGPTPLTPPPLDTIPPRLLYSCMLRPFMFCTTNRNRNNNYSSAKNNGCVMKGLLCCSCLCGRSKKSLSSYGTAAAAVAARRGMKYDYFTGSYDVPPYVLHHTLMGQEWPEGDASFYRQLPMPTLLVYGLKDPLVSLVEMCEMERTIPKSYLELIPLAGHMVMHDEARSLNVMLRKFIERHVLAR